MSLSVVVYAEGAREIGRWGSAPGDPLLDEELGPAHVLVRRAVCQTSRIPEAAVRFLAPLRDRRGRPLVGSALHDPARVRAFLRLHDAGAPAVGLLVLLVDGDDAPRRRAELVAALAGFQTPRLLGVAEPEFEAWLLGDSSAVRVALPGLAVVPAHPEALPRQQAKSLLGEPSVRIELAASVDLEVVARTCPSFGRFLRDLGGTVRST